VALIYDDPELLFHCKRLESSKNEVESFAILESILMEKINLKHGGEDSKSLFKNASDKVIEAVSQTSNYHDIKSHTFPSSDNTTIYSSRTTYNF
jgi:hypothetical protein